MSSTATLGAGLSSVARPSPKAATDQQWIACDHCGLPVRGQRSYCCFGCEIAASIHQDATRDHSRTKTSLIIGAILSMSVMMLSLFLYAEDIYELPPGHEAGLAWLRQGYRILSGALCLPALLLLGGPLLRSGLRGDRRFSMEMLVVGAASAAFAISWWGILDPEKGTYFESTAAALLLVTLGRYVEALTRSEASRRLGPLLRPGDTSAERWSGDEWQPVAASELNVGDRLRVSLERSVPADLRLDDDHVVLDLSVVSGESEGVAMSRGDTVPAGAVPLHTALHGEVLRTSEASTHEKLAALAAALAARPGRLTRWADRLASLLLPLVAAVALTVLIWAGLHIGWEEGILRALSVALVACPCTYAVATPLIQWLSLRHALNAGVLIRDGRSLERLGDVRRVAFDKTGTLTTRTLEIRLSDHSEPLERVRAMVLGLEADSPHPVAQALLDWAKDGPSITPMTIKNRRFLPARGVEGTSPAGTQLFLGRSAGGALRLIETVRGEDRTLATFARREPLRPEAQAVIDRLKQKGYDLQILTGDEVDRAEALGRRLGVPTEARLSPEAKMERLRAAGQATAFVGDGMNDAPALGFEGASFVLGHGSDVAKGVASVVLSDDDLSKVPFALELGRASTRATQRLLLASTAYNLGFIGLAATGALRPVWAGVSMLLSSLLTLGFSVHISLRKVPYA